MSSLDGLQQMVSELRQKREWNKTWNGGGGTYIFLEAAEFIEALRGKRGDPEDEAGDILVTVIAVLDHYGLSADVALRKAEIKVKAMLDGRGGMHGDE